MSRVSATRTLASSVHEAQSAWCDTNTWAQWVDGLERVERMSGPWPEAGGSVEWRSGPAGRGHVREQMVGYEPLRALALEVEDDSITGRQEVSFEPADGGCEVTLALDYTIKGRGLLTPVVDLLFIRRAMTRSLERTLGRFAERLDRVS